MAGRIVIYCSASYTIDPAYNEVARELVQALSAAGYELVSGGAVKGTMGVIAEEAARLGMPHHGVIPRFMAGLEYPGLTRITWTDTMSQRKEAMREGTVAAIALPGGVGTLDELMETLTLRKLGRYSGRVLVLNAGGFYDPLERLMDYYVETEMLDPLSRQMIAFPKSVEELMQAL